MRVTSTPRRCILAEAPLKGDTLRRLAGLSLSLSLSLSLCLSVRLPAGYPLKRETLRTRVCFARESMNVSPKEDEIVVVRMSYFEFPTKRNEISDFLGLDCGYLRKYFEYNCKYRTV